MKKQGKLNMRIIFWKCADAAYQKLLKLVHACWNYSFFETQCSSISVAAIYFFARELKL